MTLEIYRYGYGNNKWVGPLCLLVGPGLGWFFAKSALDGDVFDYHGIYLEPPYAEYLWWTFAALMAAVFFGGVYLTLYQLMGGEKRYVEITYNGITTPRQLFAVRSTYNFTDIIAVNELDFGRGRRHIRLKTRYGTGTLSRAAFDDKAEYDVILAYLTDKAQENAALKPH